MAMPPGTPRPGKPPGDWTFDEASWTWVPKLGGVSGAEQGVAGFKSGTTEAQLTSLPVKPVKTATGGAQQSGDVGVAGFKSGTTQAQYTQAPTPPKAEPWMNSWNNEQEIQFGLQSGQITPLQAQQWRAVHTSGQSPIGASIAAAQTPVTQPKAGGGSFAGATVTQPVTQPTLQALPPAVRQKYTPEQLEAHSLGIKSIPELAGYDVLNSDIVEARRLAGTMGVGTGKQYDGAGNVTGAATGVTPPPEKMFAGGTPNFDESVDRSKPRQFTQEEIARQLKDYEDSMARYNARTQEEKEFERRHPMVPMGGPLPSDINWKNPMPGFVPTYGPADPEKGTMAIDNWAKKNINPSQLAEFMALPIGERLKYMAGAMDTRDPLPSEINPQEKLIADQDPANPVSNSMAIPRAAQAEHTPYDLGGYLDVSRLEQMSRELADQQADRDYERATRELDDRYGGAGVSGAMMRNRLDLARDYALGKARTGADIGIKFNELGFGRGTALNQASDARANSLMGGALQQNALQTGILQQERDRAFQGGQADLNRTAAQNDLITRLRHEAGMKEADINATRKQSEFDAAMNYLFPPQPSPAELALMAQAGVQPNNQQSPGNSFLSYLTQQLGIDPSLLGGLFGGS